MCAKLRIRFLTITQVLCHFPVVRAISMHFRHISRETAEPLNLCQTLTDLHLFRNSDFENWSSSNQTSHNLFLVYQRFSDFDESDFEIAAL